MIKKGTPITLKWAEVYQASNIGLRRRIDSMIKDHQELHGIKDKPESYKWFVNMMGAVGEIAFAKMMNLYWPARVGAPKNDPDVLPDWQVRWREGDNASLIIREGDLDEQRFALMTGIPPVVTFRGWILAKNGKNKEWWTDADNRGKPAFFIPQRVLWDILEIEEWKETTNDANQD